MSTKKMNLALVASLSIQSYIKEVHHLLHMNDQPLGQWGSDAKGLRAAPPTGIDKEDP